MTSTELINSLKEKFKEKLVATKEDSYEIQLNSKDLLEFMNTIKTDENYLFDYLRCITSIDYRDRFAVVYNLFSYKYRLNLTIRVELPKDKPEIPSVANIWGTANWHEREAYDLMGIVFTGHPNLRRILLPEDWTGHPLRKDYIFPNEVYGLKNDSDILAPSGKYGDVR